MNFVGIDTGLGGAVALLDSELQLLDVVDMPVLEEKSGKGRVDAAGLAYLLRGYQAQGPCIAALERVGARPGGGCASSFSFGASYGIALGVIATLGVPVHLITPQVWKRAMKIRKRPAKSSCLGEVR